jgi:GTP pyrophosphokinase
VCVTPLVRKAFAVARSAHDGQTRKSGEPVLAHAVATALILADLGLDDTVVAAGLLHDTLDDTMLTSAQLEALFPGTDVPALVAGVTSMSGASQLHRDASTHSLPEEEIAGMRAMLLAMADVRVVIVKLADRLHNMRTLAALPPASQSRMAAETLAVFAPLASRLGVWAIKAELEDLCFAALHPVQAALLGDALNGASVAADVAVATRVLRERLSTGGISVLDLVGRPKNLYSTWGKLHRKGALGESEAMGAAISSVVLDARGLRCIVADEAACYAALEVVHATWPPLHGKVKDYIASPKANGYRSLHTVVSLGDGRTLEVQLRTPDMHAAAEYGLAAHWRYKQQSGAAAPEEEDDVAEVEGGVFLEQQVHWARFLLTWQRDAGGGPRTDACISSGCVFPVHRSTCPHAGHGPLGSALPPPSGAPDAKDAPVYVMVRDCTRPAGQAPRFRVVALPRGPGALKALRDTVGPVPSGAVVLVNTTPRDDIRLSGPSPPGSLDAHLQLAAGDLVDIVWGPDAAAQLSSEQPRRATKGEATREAIVAERARLMSTIGLEPLPVQA